jgi:hypothetical protein
MRLKYATVGAFVSLATVALSGVTYADPIDPGIFETTTCALGGPAAESGQCVFTAAQGGASLSPFVGMTVTTADGSAATGGDSATIVSVTLDGTATVNWTSDVLGPPEPTGDDEGFFSGPGGTGTALPLHIISGLELIPEPASLALLGAGLAAFGLIRRRARVSRV